jgi:hypothetical protein
MTIWLDPVGIEARSISAYPPPFWLGWKPYILPSGMINGMVSVTHIITHFIHVNKPDENHSMAAEQALKPCSVGYGTIWNVTRSPWINSVGIEF